MSQGTPGRRPTTTPSATPDPPPRRAGRRSPGPALVVAGRVAVSVMTAAVMAVAGAVWYFDHTLTDNMHTSAAVDAVKPGEQGYVAPHLGNDVNLLLIGLDSRKDMNGNDLPTSLVENDLHAGNSNIGGYNTNVLILMHIPANGGQVTAYSIPRDDYVERPGGTSSVPGVGTIPDLKTGKIKEAYNNAKAIAESRLVAAGVKDQAALESESREVGREATIRAVQLLTGVHVDHIAEVNLLGFYDIVKAIGSIQVCLKAPAYDPIMNGAGTGIDLPAGLDTVDAATALQFVRQRYHLPNGDLDRTHRQQAFLSSVTHKLKTEGILGDLGKMQALLKVVENDMVIDKDWDILTFAQEASNLTGGNATFYTLPIIKTADVPDGSGVPGKTTSVNIVDPAKLKDIVSTAFGNDAAVAPPPTAASDAPTSPAPSPTTSATGPKISIEVDNGTVTTGLASKVSGLLFDDGWPVAKTGNAGNIPHTTVRYGAGAADAAKDVAAKLGTGAVPAASSSLPANSVVVVVGKDFTMPAAVPSATVSGATVATSADTGSLKAGGAMTMNSSNGIPCVY
jgi:LCP family protein required for cell wall assembly